MRQLKVDYELIHEYIKAIGFTHKYERIFLVEPIGDGTAQFVIRLKFPHCIDTYPIYVHYAQWEAFLKWRESEQK